MKEEPKFDLDLIATNIEEKLPFQGKHVNLFYLWPSKIKGSSGIKNIRGKLQDTTSNFIIILDRNGLQHMIPKQNIVDMELRSDLVDCSVCGWPIRKSEYDAYNGRCCFCSEKSE